MHRRKAIFAVCLVALSVWGCSDKAQGEPSIEDKYGADADYYRGLLARRAGDEEGAMQLFTQCAASGDSIAARKSQDIAAGGADGDIENDLPALLHKCIDDKQYEKAYTYFSAAREYIAANIGIMSGSSSDFAATCATTLDKIVSRRPPIAPIAPLVSDMGKAAVYAAGNRGSRAKDMEGLAQMLSAAATGNGGGGEDDVADAVYNALFYAARLYSRAGNEAVAHSFFLQAAEKARTGEQSDNALWYLLYIQMSGSADKALSAINAPGTSPAQWHDAAYFDDLLESLSQKLLSQGRYADHTSVCAMLLADKKSRPQAYAACESAAQYAYIYARLVQEGLVTEGAAGLPSARQALEEALDGGADRYYCALAAARLADEHGDGGDMERVIFHTAASVIGGQSSADSKATPANEAGATPSLRALGEATSDTENYLLGFADFALADMIYSEWQDMTVNQGGHIGQDCAVRLCNALQKSGRTEQCLRIMAREAARTAGGVLSRQAVECLFPRGYCEATEKACRETDVPPEYAFALVRSESFFNPTVVSAAGAVGLTQLMPATAHDTARGLKTLLNKDDITDTELGDPVVNIYLGTKYLSDLLHRVGGPPMLAFLSYNTGITRVRRYVKANETSRHPLPLDLLLETLPYQETRGYGRKLLSAAVVYGYLYYDHDVQTTVHNIFGGKI